MWIKKLIVLLVVFSAAVYAVGCKATPENYVVIEKNLERMLEKAQAENSNDSMSLENRLGIPPTYKFDESFLDGKIILSGQVNVQLPSAEQIPIARVAPADFSQELIDVIYNTLVGDTAMYQVQQGVVLRENLEKEIIRLRQGNDNPNIPEDQKTHNRSILSSLEKLYTSKYVVDSIEWVPANTSLRELYVYDKYTMEKMGQYSGLALSQNPDNSVDGVIKFTVMNNRSGNSVFVEDPDGSGGLLYDNDSKGAVLRYENEAIGSSNASSVFDWGLVTLEDYPQELVSYSNFKPEQALMQVTPLVDKIGKSVFLQLEKIRLLVEFTNPNDALAIRELENSALTTKNDIVNYPQKHRQLILEAAKSAQGTVRIIYELNYCRSLDGVLVTHDVPVSWIPDSVMGRQWNNESICIQVVAEGISSFNWISPYEVVDIITKDTAMLSFSDINEIFIKMLRMQEEPMVNKTDEGIVQFEFTVTDIKLSLQRVIEKDNIEYGLLVPVWTFYGIQTKQYINNMEYAILPYTPYMTINAIDGSIIDLTKGY